MEDFFLSSNLDLIEEFDHLKVKYKKVTKLQTRPLYMWKNSNSYHAQASQMAPSESASWNFLCNRFPLSIGWIY